MARLQFLSPQRNIPGHLYPFFQRKKRGFQIVARYGHDNGIENFRAAADNADVSVGKRIKGSRVMAMLFLVMAAGPEDDAGLAVEVVC